MTTCFPDAKAARACAIPAAGSPVASTTTSTSARATRAGRIVGEGGLRHEGIAPAHVPAGAPRPPSGSRSAMARHPQAGSGRDLGEKHRAELPRAHQAHANRILRLGAPKQLFVHVHDAWTPALAGHGRCPSILGKSAPCRYPPRSPVREYCRRRKRPRGRHPRRIGIFPSASVLVWWLEIAPRFMRLLRIQPVDSRTIDSSTQWRVGTPVYERQRRRMPDADSMREPEVTPHR